MGKKHFLLEQIEKWSDTGIIDASTRGRLTTYTQDHFRDFKIDLTSLFSIFGAIAVGLGIFLFVSYNWSEMGKYEKLTLIFSSIIFFNSLGFLVSLKGNNRWLAEVFRLLGILSFGAGIALVSQIYHIVDHEPNGVFLFMLGAMITAIIYRSTAQGILTIIAICTWVIMERFSGVFPTGIIQILSAFTPLFLLVFTWVMYRTTQSFFLCLIGCIGLCITSATLLDAYTFQAILLVVPALFGGIYLLLYGRRQVELFAGLFKLFFLLTYVSILLFFTFDEYWHKVTVDRLDFFTEFERFTLFGFIAISFIFSLLFFSFITELRRSLSRQNLIDYAYFPLATGLILFVTFYPFESEKSLYHFSYLFSAIYVFYVLRLMVQGAKAQSLFLTFFGASAFAIWLFVRYMTFFDSLAKSALAFVLLGVFLILVAAYYKRCKNKNSLKEEVQR